MPAGDGPIWVGAESAAQAVCTGDEGSVFDCPNLSTVNPDCSHDQDVGVVCERYPQPSPLSGSAQCFYANVSSWRQAQPVSTAPTDPAAPNCDVDAYLALTSRAPSAESSTQSDAAKAQRGLAIFFVALCLMLIASAPIVAPPLKQQQPPTKFASIDKFPVAVVVADSAQTQKRPWSLLSNAQFVRVLPSTWWNRTGPGVLGIVLIQVQVL